MEVLSVSIGGLSIQLWSRDISLDELGETFAAFQIDSERRYDLTVELARIALGPPPDPGSETRALLKPIEGHFRRLVSALPDRDRVVECQVEAASAYLSSSRVVECLQAYHPATGLWTSFGISQSAAWFMNDAAGRARLFLPDDTESQLIQGADRYLYGLLRALLARHQGVLLHAAAVVNGDGSYLFIGPSGSGKTTIARAARALGWPVLADDGSILRWVGNGEFRAYRTPWNMLSPPWDGSFGKRPNSAIIDAVFFIEQAGADCWERLSPTTSVARLVQSAFLSLKEVEGDGTSRLFGLLAHLGSQVPCFALYFAASCGFLSDIGHVAQKGRERT